MYTKIGFNSMATRKPAEKAELHSYYQGRVEFMAKRLMDISAALFSDESLQQHQEFEDRVERRLKNGARFISRERQPR